MIRHGDNGLLAPPDDADAFVRHGLRLVNDLPAARALGSWARETVCEHGWDRIVAQIEALFLAELRAALPGVPPPGASSRSGTSNRRISRSKPLEGLAGAGRLYTG